MKKRSQIITVISLCLLTLLVIGGLALRLAWLQLVKGEEFSDSALRINQRRYNVPAARGQIYDRNGEPLVSNRLSYAVELDYLSWDKERQNQVLLDLVSLLHSRGLTWHDSLPVTLTPPFQFTMDTMDSGPGKKLSSYLDKQKGWPEGVSAQDLIGLMCEKYDVDEGYDDLQKRVIVGLRYELQQRGFSSYNPCIIAEDLDVETIALLAERHLDLPGVEIVADYSRSYATPYAAHILGRVGIIYKEEYPSYKEQGYPMNAIVGKDGLEKSFEPWLRPTSGTRTVQVDQITGDIISDLVTTAPQPGDDCYLTLDLELQAVAEQALEDTILQLRRGDPRRQKGTDAEGGAVVVLDVHTGEVLAMASYPSYSLETFNEDYPELSKDPLSPFINRAISSTYAPGSTFKMCTSIAALESGVIEPDTRIRDEGVYQYYAPSYTPACWLWNKYHRTHGNINVSEALKYSCNYFYYEVGRLAGIEVLNDYATQLGLGQKTGIELEWEKAGILAGPESREKRGGVWYGGDTLQAAIGQSDNLFTPLQICSYVATVANGGTRYQPHLLKEVRDYTGQKVLKDSTPTVLNTLDLKPSTLKAVAAGMLGVTTEDGTASSVFADFPIEVGGKTGSAELNKGSANGCFVAYAPFDAPEIAICVVGEHAGSGGNVAPVAKAIMSHYFGLDQEAAPQP